MKLILSVIGKFRSYDDNENATKQSAVLLVGIKPHDLLFKVYFNSIARDLNIATNMAFSSLIFSHLRIHFSIDYKINCLFATFFINFLAKQHYFYIIVKVTWLYYKIFNILFFECLLNYKFVITIR